MSGSEKETALQVGANKHKPRHIFEMPAAMVMTIKRNNEMLERVIKHMDVGVHTPWLKATEAAKYLRVSRSHLVQKLRGEKIPSYYDPDTHLLVFNIKDLDEYWMSRKRKI